MSNPQDLFSKLIGDWKGTCRTWFEPDVLADESQVTGTFSSLLGGKFLKHVYQGHIQGQSRSGEELMALNSVTNEFQATWIDSFHMNYAIMLSSGKLTEQGFDVKGMYDVASDQPQWGWRTELEISGEDALIITAYNVTPDGIEALALETRYTRE